MKIKIPIEILELENESYHLLVNCKVNQGQVGNLVIDTGASKTVMDKNFVTNYELLGEQTSEIQSRGLGEGSLNTEMVKIDSFQLGDLILTDFHCARIDLSGINEMYKEHCQREICGLLGSDFLVKYQAIINYRSQILQLEII
jgi:hypothetical protein